MTRSGSIEDLLLQIRDINDAILCQTDSLVETVTPSPSNHHVPIPTFHLEAPQTSHLLAQFIAAGSPSDVAQELIVIYRERARDLADSYRQVYERTCNELKCIWRPSSLQSVSALYTRIGRLQETYKLQLQTWRDDFLNRVRERYGSEDEEAMGGPSYVSVALPHKRAFNKVS